MHVFVLCMLYLFVGSASVGFAIVGFSIIDLDLDFDSDFDSDLDFDFVTICSLWFYVVLLLFRPNLLYLVFGICLNAPSEVLKGHFYLR